MQQTANKFFDLPSALMGAALMGVIVWLINLGHGPLPATIAASKQAVYTFFMAGLIARLCRYLAVRPWPVVISMAAGTLIPSIIATATTYLVHSLKGTPEPVLSTLPVLFISTPAFAVWSWSLRRKQSSTGP